jgi:DNA-directed RNA polymerase subunit RPC12/RpoP
MGALDWLREALGYGTPERSDLDPADVESEFRYKCLQCHENFTSANRKSRAECPECGSVKLRGGSPTTSGTGTVGDR